MDDALLKTLTLMLKRAGSNGRGPVSIRILRMLDMEGGVGVRGRMNRPTSSQSRGTAICAARVGSIKKKKRKKKKEGRRRDGEGGGA